MAAMSKSKLKLFDSGGAVAAASFCTSFEGELASAKSARPSAKAPIIPYSMLL